MDKDAGCAEEEEAGDEEEDWEIGLGGRINGSCKSDAVEFIKFAITLGMRRSVGQSRSLSSRSICQVSEKGKKNQRTTTNHNHITTTQKQKRDFFLRG